MPNFLKKILIPLIMVAIMLHLSIMGVQAFFSWQNNQQNNNLQNDEKDQRNKEKEILEIEKLRRDLEGYQGNYTLYEWDDKKGYLGIKGKGFEEIPNVSAEGMRIDEGILLFSQETKRHFSQIVRDIDDWLKKPNHQLEPIKNLSNSHNYPHLVRNNCILYGAPGTGKTEFVRELNHLLIKRYGEEYKISEPSNDPNDPNYGMSINEQDREKALKGIKKPRIPIFEIKGADIMSTGKNEPKTYEKLAATIRKAKEQFFKDENSQLPYIVFLEEGDQAKNPLTYNPQAKNNLEELKNFFSTGSESKGLSANAQDRNSVFIVATNNDDTIDIAMKRWGRLGVSLNFTWSPETIKEYGEELNAFYHINWLRSRLPVTPFVQDHYCWKFANNEDRNLLFEVAKEMNFYNYEKDFVSKTNQILKLWDGWEEEERDDFARNRLGLESKVWCDAHNQEEELEKFSQKATRIKNALKKTKDAEEKERIFAEESQKLVTTCGNEAKPICNWLLHYLHTFFNYSRRQDLEKFDNPNKIERYSFNEKRLLREKINQLRLDLTEVNQNVANTMGEELRRVSNSLERLNKSEDNNHVELSNIRNVLDELSKRLIKSSL